jgi:hypothetical protein
MTRGWSERGGVPAVTLLVVVALFGCGAEGEQTENLTTAPDAAGNASALSEPFCDAALRLGNPGEPEVDWETASEEEMAAAEQVFGQEVLQPIVEELRASAPEEVQGEVDTLDAVLQDADGGLEPFFSGDGGTARDAITQTAAQGCGWSEVAVTAVDYGYEGVPETIDAGTAIFTMTNEGEEGHEMILFRRNDGVEESFEELLEMDDAMEFVEFAAAAFAPAGETSSAAADLRAGDYVMVCFIPVGSDAYADETGDGPPHFEEGMWTSFSVS